MELDEILHAVPDYKEFLTVDELNQSSTTLAEEFDFVEKVDVGKSRADRPISYLKLGEGEKRVLLFAFPHPNEPIGSMTIEFLSRYLAENEQLREELDCTWYLIKAIDPDGAALNEGWFKGEFDPVKYVLNYYRPPSHEQVEWTFPVEYKNLSFSNPPVETQALMKVIEETRPSLMYSLHNAGFCGVYFYISHPIEPLYNSFSNLVKGEDLPLHKGEPETPFIEKLHPAIFKMFGIQESYDFYEENGVANPEELIKGGTSSHDYLMRITDGEGFTLVCEMPYFYDEAIEDDSLTGYDRRELVLSQLEFSLDTHKYTKDKFGEIKDYCYPKSRLYTSVADQVENFEDRILPRFRHAKTSPMYEGKATVAQAFDSTVARKYYTTLRAGMISRLCKLAMNDHPKKRVLLQDTYDELVEWIENTVEEALEGTNFEVIPIKKLVRVQAGSALLTLKNISNK
jgi:hypothetical protein